VTWPEAALKISTAVIDLIKDCLLLILVLLLFIGVSEVDDHRKR